MNPFGKALAFVIMVLTRTSTVASQVSKLSGPVLAAMLAVFYDTVKTFQAAEAAAAAGTAGNIPLAISLSETTVSLVKNVVTDAKAGEKLIVADLQSINIPTAHA